MEVLMFMLLYFVVGAIIANYYFDRRFLFTRILITFTYPIALIVIWILLKYNILDKEWEGFK